MHFAYSAASATELSYFTKKHMAEANEDGCMGVIWLLRGG